MSAADHLGCHGVAVSPTHLGRRLGRSKPPLPLDARVEPVDIVPRRSAAAHLWTRRHLSVDGREERRELWQEPGGQLWYSSTTGSALRADLDARLIEVAAPSEGTLLSLVAGWALPMLQQAAGQLVLHASAACGAAGATLICGPSGSGKSSLLTALLTRGWSALCEDVSVIDTGQATAPQVWPGPPWVRTVRPPEGRLQEWRPIFRTADKTAWDLEGQMADRPAAVVRVVVLDPPGGSSPRLEVLDPGEAIGELSRHVVRLDARYSARRMFPQIVELATRAEVVRLRCPNQPAWASIAATALTGNGG